VLIASRVDRVAHAHAHRTRADSFDSWSSTFGALVTHAREVDRGLGCA